LITKRQFLFLSIILIITKLIVAILFPITTDEAYYASWSKDLAWGYLDHPPMVSLLGILASVSPWLLRLPGFLLWLLAFYVMHKCCQIVFREHALKASLVVQASLFSLSAGILNTPDSLVYFFWAVFIYAVLKSIYTDSKYWILCGIAVGLGMLSKYTFVLAYLVLLVSLFYYPRWRSNGHFWLGGILSLLIFMPHMMWNFEHDFRSFRFQLDRGLASKYDASLGQQKSWVLAFDNDSPEARYSEFFLDSGAKDPHVKEQKSRREKPLLKRVTQQVGDYLGASLFIFGFGIFILRFRRVHPFQRLEPFLYVCTALPFLFFLGIAFFNKTEANWNSMFSLTLALIMTPWLRSGISWILGLHLGILVLAVIHSYYPIIDIKSDRLLIETQGYEKLTEYTAGFDELYVESYQIASMLEFYGRNQNRIYQVPGWTRLSNYSYKSPDLEKLPMRLWLLGSSKYLPIIADYQIESARRLMSCKGRHELWLQYAFYPRDLAPDCSVVHDWKLMSYIRRND
jgi:4-amino-4-deoxy-L-arabinose transferase-like glycosyltransferase